MVNGGPLRNCIVGTAFNGHHNALVNALSEIGVGTGFYIAVVLFDGCGKVCTGNRNLSSVIGALVDFFGQCFKAVGFENSVRFHTALQLSRSYESAFFDDFFVHNTEGGEPARVFSCIRAYVAAFAFVYIAFALVVYIDNTGAGAGEGNNRIGIQNTAVRVGERIELDV